MKEINPDEERSVYFQSIARHFLARRGAPFFLSAKDLNLIAAWEEARIPLPVVIEGIEKAFENFRRRPQKKEKVLSLLFCQAQVLKAFELDRDRRVGQRRRFEPRDDKRRRARAETEKFLARLPRDISFLKDVFLEALEKMAETEMSEEHLERLDECVERLLVTHADVGDQKTVGGEIQVEYRNLGRQERERIFEIRLVKHLRDKYKIPYLSFFYY
jgi:hypothetical protein